ncbi:response regulator [Costertonia aggregata]|uniref:Response regulator n=1 Tax=Costertonia aggregata TaxID=343403 RepID=A0A7H9AQ47_9FLAO|nr:response regulator [Costertonia aggregata]QLG45570.1 response regulator [Costertonia aggregata]
MGKFKTVCIIDDDEISVFGLKRYMSQVDFCENLLVFKDGEEALQELKKHILDNRALPDAIFVDLHMPMLDGWEFIEEFSRLQQNTILLKNIYILSSSVDKKNIEKAKKFGLEGNYLIKPITPEILKGFVS